MASQEAMIQEVTPRILAVYQPDIHAEAAFLTTFQTAMVGSFEIQNQMMLTFGEGRWSVEWSPALLFPQLSDETFVRLTTWAPSRGNIYDRNGLGLAVQGELVEVGVVPGQIEDETALLAQLSTILGESPADLQARYADALPEWYVPLGLISAEAGQLYYETLSSTPGVELREAWTRSYRQEIIALEVGNPNKYAVENIQIDLLNSNIEAEPIRIDWLNPESKLSLQLPCLFKQTPNPDERTSLSCHIRFVCHNEQHTQNSKLPIVMRSMVEVKDEGIFDLLD